MKKFSMEIACKQNCFDFWNSCKRLQNFVNVEAPETPNDVQSVAYHSWNTQATSKGSDQAVHIASCTYHIVGNLMSRLMSLLN